MKNWSLNESLKYTKIFYPSAVYAKKIRDDSGKEPGTGDWIAVEQYLYKETEIDITSGYCPDCAEKIEYELGLKRIKFNILSCNHLNELFTTAEFSNIFDFFFVHKSECTPEQDF